MSSLRRLLGIALCILGLQAVDASAQQVVCYAFSDGATQLVGLQGQGSTPSGWSTVSNPIYSRSISGLPLDAVESLYFDTNADRFYTVDQGSPQDPTPDRFGYLNLTSGTFVPISPSTGIGSGTRPGTTTTLVVGDNTGQTTGLAYDRTTQTLWGVTLSGHLYQIDIATGALVQNAFGTNEFARVRQGAGNGNGNAITAVEDISFAADGTMYVVTNTSGNSGPAKLYTVDKTGTNPGQVTSVVDISVSGSVEDEFEGLSFGPNGVLYATTGYGTFIPADRNKMWSINPSTGVATKLYDFPSSNSVDFESIGCTWAEADLSILKSNTPAVNGGVDQANDTVASGATVNYTITAQNDGPALANGAVLHDPTPTGLTCTTATCTASGAATCPTATGTALVSALQSAAGASIATFPPGETVTIVMTCTVD